MSQTAARAAQVDKIKNQMMQVWVSVNENRIRFRKSCLCTSYIGLGRLSICVVDIVTLSQGLFITKGKSIRGLGTAHVAQSTINPRQHTCMNNIQYIQNK
jgi:hypothetical protein